METYTTLWELVTGWKFSRGGPTALEPVKRRSFTATDTEYKHIQEMAQKNGLPTARYIRLLVIKDIKDGGMSPQKEKNKIKKAV